jgi:hypothetical protein
MSSCCLRCMWGPLAIRTHCQRLSRLSKKQRKSAPITCLGSSRVVLRWSSPRRQQIERPGSQIEELMTKSVRNGLRDRYFLVANGTSAVLPTRGRGMVNTKLLWTVCVATVFAVALSQQAGAQFHSQRTTYLTFSQPAQNDLSRSELFYGRRNVGSPHFGCSPPTPGQRLAPARWRFSCSRARWTLRSQMTRGRTLTSRREVVVVSGMIAAAATAVFGGQPMTASSSLPQPRNAAVTVLDISDGRIVRTRDGRLEVNTKELRATIRGTTGRAGEVESRQTHARGLPR